MTDPTITAYDQATSRRETEIHDWYQRLGDDAIVVTDHPGQAVRPADLEGMAAATIETGLWAAGVHHTKESNPYGHIVHSEAEQECWRDSEDIQRGRRYLADALRESIGGDR